MKEQSGTVFNIQRFCVHDGEGIRTVVFLKGCKLRCLWCHNPDGLNCAPELAFYEERCIDCRRCETVCPEQCHTFGTGHKIARQACNGCGKCVKECPSGALEIVGKTMTAQEVVRECEKDMPYYLNSGGGITLSGGEPLLQAEFSSEILRLSKEKGMNTAVETGGYVERARLEKVSAYTDTFLFDYKVTDEAESLKYTGSDGRTSIENLKWLDRIGKRIVLRCPIIPSVNDNERHYAAIAKLANSLKCVQRVELMFYHSLGAGKNRSLGRSNGFTVKEFSEAEKSAVWHAVKGLCPEKKVIC